MASIEYLTDTNKSNSICTSTSSITTVKNITLSSTIKCKRVGCENPAIEHPEWDGEYCSAQCLSIFCKEAFEQWIKKRQ